jgi:predicted dienelactone hydrolase
LPPQPDFLSNKPVAAGIGILRTVSITILVVVLLFLALIGVFGAVIHFGDHREVVLPKPTGPFAVGRTLFDWTDPERDDPYSSAIGKHRELMVWFWYPATVTPESRPAEYIPADWASLLPWRPVTIPSRVRVHAIADPPVAADRQTYPVLIFSTGFGNLPSDYTSLIEDIASHGYVVLGITNTYSAPVVRFPDGRVANHLAEASFPGGPSEAIQSAGNRMVDVWAADIRFAIDKLAQMNSDAKSRFQGRLDLSKIGLLGHSFGGAASVEACLEDARCEAAIDIDGNLFGDVAREGIRKPLLFVLSDWTLRPPWLARTLASVSVQRFRRQQVELEREMNATCRKSSQCWKAHIPGTGHFNFTDLAVLYSPGMRLMGYLGPVNGAKGLEETSSCIRTFFGTILNGQSPNLPAGSSKPGCQFQALGNTPGNSHAARR